jgi:hypothetical protein
LCCHGSGATRTSSDGGGGRGRMRPPGDGSRVVRVTSSDPGKINSG